MAKSTAKIDFTDKFKGFADKVANEEVKLPIQKVVPVEEKKSIKNRDTEKQFNVWINSDTLKKLKMKSIEDDVSIKEIINKAIEKYLKE